MNTLIQDQHKHSKSCITDAVSGRAQKVKVYLANEGSGLALLITDLVHVFWSDVSKEFGVMLRGKRSQKPDFP